MDYQRNVARLIGEVFTALSRQLDKELRAADLPITPEQFRILTELWTQDGITQIELAARGKRDRASITRIVDLLEEKGLIARHDDPNDRRVKLICLTPPGRALEQKARPAAQRAIAATLAPLTAEERQALTALLEKIKARGE
ncbi:MAG: MarR family transcriptional regulator [Cytophagales bacterium]|nr:MarR family transcriptional regulator [Cytophagales bacterium]